MVEVLPAEDWHTTVVYLNLTHRLAPTTGTHPELYHSVDDVWSEITNILATLARSISILLDAPMPALLNKAPNQPRPTRSTLS